MGRWCLWLLVLSATTVVRGEEFFLHSFAKQQLSIHFWSEGATLGDFNRDGKMDVVSGPYWYQGPDFKTKHEIYEPKMTFKKVGADGKEEVIPGFEGGLGSKNTYSDNFFAFTHDFNNDGWTDVLIYGFPGQDASWYQNPQDKGGRWTRHKVFETVDNESPQWGDITGDGKPEIICHAGGFLGYVCPDWSDASKPWTFHKISAKGPWQRFTHGLGFGDVNGDGRTDFLLGSGWWEQPASLEGDPEWKHHPEQWGNGAQMHVYDVNGDGLNDVVTSLQAHGFGLAWFEQYRVDVPSKNDDGSVKTVKEIRFKQNLIMGQEPKQNRYGLKFAQLHAVELVDMDGDGLKDIVTGKRFWAHGPKGDAESDAPAVVYWFKLVRNADKSVDWVPQFVDDDSGVGTQVVVGDLNGDKLPDIVVGNKKGTFIHLHETKKVSKAEWEKAQPHVISLAPVLRGEGRGEGPDQAAAVKDGGSAPKNPSPLPGVPGRGEKSVPGGLMVSGNAGGLGAQPVNDVVGELPKGRDGKPLNTDFENGDLRDWTATGNAFNKQPIAGDVVNKRRKDSHSRHDGQYWIGGYEVVQDAGLGTLTSAPFRVTQPFAAFRVAGGAYDNCRVELVRADNDEVIFRTTVFEPDVFQRNNDCKEDMRPCVVDLSTQVGKEIFIRIVDQQQGHWAHLNFDDFKLYAKRPLFVDEFKAVKEGLKQLGPAKGQPSTPADQFKFAGLSPEEAAKAMTVPPGFKVTLFAGEPDVVQPIAMAIDDKGRLWVAEAYSYPARVPDEQAKDRIIILEDTDNDGRFDKRKVFIDKLNLVSGLEVGFGGVWVGAAPYLLFIPDRDGDDVPDGREVGEKGSGGVGESASSSPPLPLSPTPPLAVKTTSNPPDVPANAIVLLDGWGSQDTHETLNSFIWGPDGWLYGCHGVFTHSNVGKPGATDEQRQKINAGIWRYHPVKHQFEVFAHGTSNPWGVDFNDRGQAFLTACVIPHLWHVIQNARYQRQAGPHFNPFTYDDIKTIAVHRHYVGGTAHGGNGRSDSAGGGHAHAGAMIYLGGSFPHRYRDQIFMNNIHGARLNQDVLKASGSGYSGDRAPDFLLANDAWSQILYMTYGPDGSVYMIDWYDKNQCHHGNSAGHDRTNGRIFKVSYVGNEKVTTATSMSSTRGSETSLGQSYPRARHPRVFASEERVDGSAKTHTDDVHTDKTAEVGIASDQHLECGDSSPLSLSSRLSSVSESRVAKVARHVLAFNEQSKAGDTVERKSGDSSPHSKLKDFKGDLKTASNEQLIELQLHDNDWYVRHARRILQERAAAQPPGPTSDVMRKVHAALSPIAYEHADETRQLRGLWALHVTGGLKKALLSAALNAKSPFVRAWAIQLHCEPGTAAPGILSRFVELAQTDDSPVVRKYLASVALRLPLKDRAGIIKALVAHAEDSDDHNLPLLYWYAVESLVAERLEEALDVLAVAKVPTVRAFLIRRLAQTGEPSVIDKLIERTLTKDATSADQLTALREINEGLKGRRKVEMPKSWTAAFPVVLASTDADVRSQAMSLAITFGDPMAVEAQRRILNDAKAAPAARLDALQALVKISDSKLAPSLQALVGDEMLGAAAVRSLAAYDDPKTPDVLLGAFDKMSADLKRDALATLCSRPAYANALLSAVEAKKVPTTALTADLITQLRNLKQPALNERIGKVWGIVRDTPEEKAQEIERLKKLLAAKPKAENRPDVALGRAVYAKTCQNCHTLFGVGQKIGPDITGSNRANIDYLLSNLVDPSALVGKDYQVHIVALKNGRVLSGLVKVEDDQAVTLATAFETVVVPKNEIEERVVSDKSLMPENQFLQMTEREVRSLVAYLASPTQTPIAATADTVKQFFNGKDLTGWTGDMSLWSVENGELIGRTSGLKHNEFLKSDLLLSDFRLSVDVKLLKNEGNSGIQFRSEVQPDGHMKGYQADIGPGWWGKLYEEHGRALLWDKSGEQHLKPGEWNRYEVEAIGPRIRTYLNGQLCVDLNDEPGARSGLVGLQLHSGGATEVRFKNVIIELK